MKAVNVYEEINTETEKAQIGILRCVCCTLHTVQCTPSCTSHKAQLSKQEKTLVLKV